MKSTIEPKKLKIEKGFLPKDILQSSSQILLLHLLEKFFLMLWEGILRLLKSL